MAEEAIIKAVDLRVIRPEYLIAMAPEPAEDLLTRLAPRQGPAPKTAARDDLARKVRQVVELQKMTLPMIRRRRALDDWERVWPLRER